MDEVKDEIESQIGADNRVIFLGWQKPGEQADVLCTADVYRQSGRQSSTM